MSLTYDQEELKAKAEDYCVAHGTIITNRLGYGTQGMVFKTDRDTAIKIHSLEVGYQRELGIYKRLKERTVQSIRGLQIPRLMDWDDTRFILEMSIVHVPCVIDFGGAYLDNPPEHMLRDDEWMKTKAEEFEDNWDEAQAVIREIEFRADIWLSDVNTGNIKFPGG